MQDLTIDVDGYKLNIRAAVIINHDNKILTHKNINSDHYALIGGRVEIGEDSEKTVIREITEEIGKQVEITGYVGTVENFFEMKGSKYHEILFIHEAEFVDKKDKMIIETLKNVEGKEYLQYEWLDIDKIDEYPLKPNILKEMIKEKNLPMHKIHHD